MKVLNLLVTGNPGGIETLCKNISLNKTNIENIWMFIFSGGIITDEIKKNSKDKVEVLNEKKNFIKIIIKITKYCKDNAVDIITVHHGGIYTNLIYLVLKTINKEIKFVRYLHSCFDKRMMGNSNIKRRIDKKVLQKAINKSDLVICVSNAVKHTHLANLNIRNKNVKVIYNGISKKFFANLNTNTEKNENLNLIYVGRLERVKGVDILIDALPIVKKEFKDINLLIIGDGSELENLKQRAWDNQVYDNVKFLGNQLEIIEWLDEANIFIYPTRWKEAFGISVVEAMARGLVPITFNQGGLNEIIEDGKNGFLIENVKTEELAKQIIFTLNNENLVQIKEKAIETSKKFTIENTIKGIEKAYIEISK